MNNLIQWNESSLKEAYDYYSSRYNNGDFKKFEIDSKQEDNAVFVPFSYLFFVEMLTGQSFSNIREKYPVNMGGLIHQNENGEFSVLPNEEQTDYILGDTEGTAIRRNVVNWLTNNYTEEGIQGEIDESIVSGDFLPDGWEEDYEDEYEAYSETGRNEIETGHLDAMCGAVEFEFDITQEGYESKVGESITDTIKSVFGCLNKD